MPIVPVVIAVAVDVAAEVGAADLVATIAAGTIFADAAGTLTVVGDIAAGALGGLVGGAVTAGIEGGNPLIGGLEGAAGGALTGGIAGITGGASLTGGDLPTSAAATDVGTGTLSGSQGFFSGLTSSVANITGLPTQAVNTVLKTLTGAATGALKNAATGQDPGAGALGGAISGGAGSGLGAIASNTIDVNQIAADTGLPANIVTGVINGLGQAATGAAASAATGGDPGIAAAGDFASGVLPSALQWAESAAKSVYNTLVSGGQQAVTDIVNTAQTQLTALQTTLERTWSGPLQDAQAAYQSALDSANSQLQTLANQPFLGLQFAEAESENPNNFPEVQTALQNLQTVSAQAQQAEQDAQTQAQKITDAANAQISAYQDPSTAASQYFDQAFQTAAQGLNNGDTGDQIQAALDAINPIGTAQAETPLSPSQYSGQVNGATVTYDLGDGTGVHTGTVDHLSSSGIAYVLTDGSSVGVNLVNTITAPNTPTNFDLSGSSTTTTIGGNTQPQQPPTQQPTPPAAVTQGAGSGGGGDTSGGTGTGTDTTQGDNVTAPSATSPDQAIMRLVGLTSPESAGADTASQSQQSSKPANFNFTGGFNSAAAPGQPTQAPNIEPGSAALAQALSIPGTGPGLGGDIFGTKGQRTPIWNLESLRSEDNSGV